jgi:hypothetical protein
MFSIARREKAGESGRRFIGNRRERCLSEGRQPLQKQLFTFGQTTFPSVTDKTPSRLASLLAAGKNNDRNDAQIKLRGADGSAHRDKGLIHRDV